MTFSPMARSELHNASKADHLWSLAGTPFSALGGKAVDRLGWPLVPRRTLPPCPSTTLRPF